MTTLMNETETEQYWLRMRTSSVIEQLEAIQHDLPSDRDVSKMLITESQLYRDLKVSTGQALLHLKAAVRENTIDVEPSQVKILKGAASCSNHDWIPLKSVLQRSRIECPVYECQNTGCESVKVVVS